jgi:hypothetical protein
MCIGPLLSVLSLSPFQRSLGVVRSHPPTEPGPAPLTSRSQWRSHPMRAPFPSLAQGCAADKRESARPEQLGEALARRRCALDPKFQRQALSPGTHSCITPIECVRGEDLGCKVVECDNTALRSQDDGQLNAQHRIERCLQGWHDHAPHFPVQVHVLWASPPPLLTHTPCNHAAPGHEENGASFLCKYNTASSSQRGLSQANRCVLASAGDSWSGLMPCSSIQRSVSI